MMVSAAFKEILYMKGYLLNVPAMKRYSLLLKGSIGYFSRKHELDGMGCFMLHADLASLHIVCNVSIHSGPVDGCSC